MRREVIMLARGADITLTLTLTLTLIGVKCWPTGVR